MSERNARSFRSDVRDIEDCRKALDKVKQLLVPKPWRSFDVTWGSSGTVPAIGNGTLVGKFHRNAWRAWVSIELTIGSTTTPGTGIWVFLLPTQAIARPISPRHCGAAFVFDNGTGYRCGTSVIEAGGADRVRVYLDGVATAIGAGVPITWANGDRVNLSIDYPAVAP